MFMKTKELNLSKKELIKKIKLYKREGVNPLINTIINASINPDITAIILLSQVGTDLSPFK